MIRICFELVTVMLKKKIHLLERHAEFYQCILNLNTCTEILIYGKKL